ncbi:MAG: hypothetical protein FWE95_12225 [Planctomycetaceae bacterium]|nr:hypothetical protein [Planctomycetaceae bacterium]
MTQFTMNNSLGKQASENNPTSRDTSLDPASELLRQGNKLASQEQFSDADKVFRIAASLPGGKAIWNFKSLGFCPTVFSDVSSIDAFWQQLDQGLDQVWAYKHWKNRPLRDTCLVTGLCAMSQSIYTLTCTVARTSPLCKTRFTAASINAENNG